MAFYLIKNKEHLTLDGIKKLIAIKSSMNKGLSDELKTAFPDVTSITRPLLENKKILNSNWLAGFISAEGCFFIHIEKSSKALLPEYNPDDVKEKVRLRFQISQHVRDTALLNSFIEYFGCGNYYARSNQNVGDFVVTKFTDINEKIIPFLGKYPIFGVKDLDYKDICKLAELIKNKAHLTKEGLEQIKKIKAKMNRNRID